MAKLFKTISLEERLKNSSYNNLPTTSKEVNQGSFVPKEKAKNYTSAQETLLRKIPEGLREGSIMLKKLISIADIKKANRDMRYAKTPNGLVWHHDHSNLNQQTLF